jgi:repressor LexA
MLPDTGLSGRQQEILAFLGDFTSKNGYPPSVREIGEAVGLSSSSTVHSHLNTLENKGFIRRDPSSARALTVIDRGARAKDSTGARDAGESEGRSGDTGRVGGATSAVAVGATSSAEAAEVEATATAEAAPAPIPLPRNVVELPLVGRVAAGSPILAEQNIEESFMLPTQIVSDASSFLLTVRGESMIEAGILDGDYVVVKEQPTANNGEIVVALIDDEATVKTFYREPDRIRLQPENHTMEPIYTRDVTILGKVIALLRAL